MLDIDTPLPTVKEDEIAIALSAEIMDLAFRKINAMYDSRALLPVILTKSDGGFLFTLQQ